MNATTLVKAWAGVSIALILAAMFVRYDVEFCSLGSPEEFVPSVGTVAASSELRSGPFGEVPVYGLTLRVHTPVATSPLELETAVASSPDWADPVELTSPPAIVSTGERGGSRLRFIRWEWTSVLSYAQTITLDLSWRVGSPELESSSIQSQLIVNARCHVRSDSFVGHVVGYK